LEDNLTASAVGTDKMASVAVFYHLFTLQPTILASAALQFP